MGRVSGGFLIGFGTCLLLLGIGPVYLAEVVHIIRDMPEAPSSKAMRAFILLLKNNPFAYEAAKRIYEIGVTYYEVINKIWEVRLFYLYSIIIGSILVMKGLLSLRSKRKDIDDLKEKIKREDS